MYPRGPYKRYKIDDKIPVPRRTRYRQRHDLLGNGDLHNIQHGNDHVHDANVRVSTDVISTIAIKFWDFVISLTQLL